MANDTEMAWAAGFFDGEGTIFVYGKSKYFYPCLAVSQVDRRPLDRFATAIGYSTVRGPYTPRSSKSNAYYKIEFYGSKVDEIMAKMYPYLSEPKKEQCKKVMETIYAKRFLHTA